MSVHQARTHARRQALQLLYQSEISGLPISEILACELYTVDEGSPDVFARMLACGVADAMAEIDVWIGDTSENWSLTRMPLVDKAILRLATYEMLYVDDVPQSVTINEAVELAKDFGGEDESSRFVNGVLGRIAERVNENTAGVQDATLLEEALPGVAVPCKMTPDEKSDLEKDSMS